MIAWGAFLLAAAWTALVVARRLKLSSGATPGVRRSLPGFGSGLLCPPDVLQPYKKEGV